MACAFPTITSAATLEVLNGTVHYGDGVEPLDAVVQVSYQSAEGGGSTMTVRLTQGSGAPTAGTGCSSMEGPPAEASCTLPRGVAIAVAGSPGADAITVTSSNEGIVYVTADLGAGDDSFDVSGLFGSCWACSSQTRLLPGDGNDTVYTCACLMMAPDLGAGSDTLSGAHMLAAREDGMGFVLVKGKGRDKSADFEHVVGSLFRDIVESGVLAHDLSMGEGNDSVTTSPFDQTIDLGPGDDEVVDVSPASAGQRVTGGQGTDTFQGTSGTGPAHSSFICLSSSLICGRFDGRRGERDEIGTDLENIRMRGNGEDVLVGNAGPNVIYAGDGSDTVFGGGGADVLSGGSGTDFVAYSFRRLQPRGVTATLDGRRNDGGPATGLIYHDVEGVIGSAFADKLQAGRHSGRLFGMGGNDLITGNRSPDYLDGGPGNDRINARGGGPDVVTCGPGRDTARVDASDEVSPNCEHVIRT